MDINCNKLKAEFDHIPSRYDELQEYVEQMDARELYATGNIFEIEPFFSQVRGLYMDNVRFIRSQNEFNPSTDELYLYKMNLEFKTIYFKRRILGSNTCYETFYIYEDDFDKSISFYISGNEIKAHSLCYVYYENALLHTHVECNEYGVEAKAYHVSGKTVNGYVKKFYDFNGIQQEGEIRADFAYAEPGVMERVEELYGPQEMPQRRIVYQRFDEDKSVSDSLKTIEDYLVHQVYDQIASMPIKEKVFCVILEYNLQTIFPPTVAIGTESDREAMKALGAPNPWDQYSAPDMSYFNEEKTLAIDLYSAEIQPEYLFIDKTNKEMVRQKDAAWNSRIDRSYIGIAKRLMDKNFTKHFPITDDFLVMVRDFERYNNETCFHELMGYKKEKVRSNHFTGHSKESDR